MKINPREDLSEPYLFSSSGNKKDLVLVSSISVPILKEEKYVGLLQFDMNLERFQDMIDEIRPFRDSYGFLISSNGAYIASTNENLVNKKINGLDTEDNTNNKIIENIKLGKKYSYIEKDSTNTEYYVSNYPVKIGKSEKRKNVNEEFKKGKITTLNNVSKIINKLFEKFTIQQ